MGYEMTLTPSLAEEVDILVGEKDINIQFLQTPERH